MSRRFEIPPLVATIAVPGGECRFRLATVAELYAPLLSFTLIELEGGYAVIVLDAGPLAPLALTHKATRVEVEANRLRAEALREAASAAGAHLRELTNPRLSST